MAASTVDIPAIVLSGGPMLDGWHDGDLVGSGTVIWRSRRKLAAGQINEKQFLDAAAASAPSLGHCNTMGTASTMNAVAEVLGTIVARLRCDSRALSRTRPDFLRNGGAASSSSRLTICVLQKF
jgi:dihydroxyacid dehydratase/phosphogluconate dehydratase